MLKLIETRPIDDLFPSLGKKNNKEPRSFTGSVRLLKAISYEERLSYLNTKCPDLPLPFVQEAATILTYGNPSPFSDDLWQNVILKTWYLVQEQSLVARVLKSGWSLKDFFGCNAINPIERIDRRGYAVSGYKDRIVSYDDKVLRAELHTKGHITYVPNTRHEEVALVSELVDTKTEKEFCKAPNDNTKKTIIDYLNHHKNSPAWGYRTLERISHYLSIDRELIYSFVPQMIEEGKIKQEYAGVLGLA